MMTIFASTMMYIDPGTGGLLFQALAAAAVTISGFILFFSRQIKMYFARFRRFLQQKIGRTEL